MNCPSGYNPAPQSAAGEYIPRSSPAASAFLAETVRLNSDLKALTRRLGVLARIHHAALDECCVCATPWPCATYMIASGQLS